ncbi:MAG: lamin tail domain-containing protein, partial [Parcubacteria group bacterium]
MKRSKERGEILEPILILLALLSILVFFILPKSGSKWPDRSVLGGPRDTSQSVGSNPSKPPTTSAYSRNVTLDVGNAKQSQDAEEEYIIIRNKGGDPINISGWRLVNGKANRAYVVNGQSVTYPSEVVYIPMATGYISPIGFNVGQDVVLKSGEKAIITTGSISTSKPYTIVSFKENICSGLLDGRYSFIPRLEISGVGNISYPDCIEKHKDDADFYKSTWRIFLNRKWELWAE